MFQVLFIYMKPILLTRDQFRDRVFERDSYKCVICGQSTNTAHHIIDRSLWDDEGYYLENGVTVCPPDHLDAERTLISCEQLRQAAGIPIIHLPDHFYTDEKYDHWGNIVLPNKMRIRGELLGNENVQKILQEADVLDLFLKYVKYPRTFHCPWSPGLSGDDRRHDDITFLLGKPIVATIKMDGEQSNLYPDHFHARSIDSAHHPSRSWVKALHGRIAHDIPEGYRICGENVYAKHSIFYEHLKTYFYVYSIWDENNVALSWDETHTYCDLLGLETVPEICFGTYSTVEALRRDVESNLEAYAKQSKDEVEGYVIRLAGRIPYRDFRKSTAKVVRRDHVQTDENWMNQPVIPNKLI